MLKSLMVVSNKTSLSKILLEDMEINLSKSVFVTEAFS